MEIRELLPLVEKWAPTLAKNLIGPYGNLVLNILTSAYGTKNKFDLQELAEQITNNPYRLKELEIRHREAVGSQLVGLLEIVEQRGSNALLWVVGLLLAVCFVAYVIVELIH